MVLLGTIRKKWPYLVLFLAGLLIAYFKNLPLLVACIGLGIGFTLVRRRENLFPLTRYTTDVLGSLFVI